MGKLVGWKLAYRRAEVRKLLDAPECIIITTEYLYELMDPKEVLWMISQGNEQDVAS